MLMLHGILARMVASSARWVCWFRGNLDRSLLVHLANGGQFHALGLHDVVGRPIADSVIWIFVVYPSAHLAGIEALGVGSNGRQVVFRLAALAACELAVTAVVAGFGFDDQVATSQGVQEDINKTRAGDHSTSNTEVDHVRCGTLRRGHTSGGQWKRQDDIRNRVDNHVSDNATQALQTLRVAASQDS